MIAAPYCTRAMAPGDSTCGFRSGSRPLDDYFRRHASPNDAGDIGRAWVIEASAHDTAAGLPQILGFYTLSMAAVTSTAVSPVVARSLPRYPMPVALIGRLAVDERARGRRLGERLLLDALARIVDAAQLVACLGVIVDAKDSAAESFYSHYDFVSLNGPT